MSDILKKIIFNDQESLAIGLSTKNLTLSKPIKDYSLNITNWSIIGIFVLGLVLIIYGVFNLDWHINELSAIFLIIAFLTGLFSKMGGNSMSKIVLESVAVAAPGAFMVGFATTIKVLMEMGNIEIQFRTNFQLFWRVFLFTSQLSACLSHNLLLIFYTIWKWASTCHTSSNDPIRRIAWPYKTNYYFSFSSWRRSNQPHKSNAWWFNCNA